MRPWIPGLGRKQGELAIDFNHPLFEMGGKRGKVRVDGVNPIGERRDH